MADKDVPDLRDMGEGRVEAHEFEAVLRVVRHNVSNLWTVQAGQQDLVRMAAQNSADALVTANNARTDVAQLKLDLFGDPRRGSFDDGGAIGRIESQFKGLRNQNWMILFTVIGAVITGIVTFVVNHL